MKQSIDELFSLKENNPAEVGPLILAYVGDSIYEVVVRQIVASRGNRSTDKLHKEATALVNAGRQAAMIEALEPDLTETELSIYKRGRNAKSGSSAKNASINSYRKATGFEALMGYLYLSKEMDRMLELIRLGIERTEKENGTE